MRKSWKMTRYHGMTDEPGGIPLNLYERSVGAGIYKNKEHQKSWAPDRYGELCDEYCKDAGNLDGICGQ